MDDVPLSMGVHRPLAVYIHKCCACTIVCMCPSLRAHLYTPADRLTELAEYEHAVRTTLAALSEGRVGGEHQTASSSGATPYLPDEVARVRAVVGSA